MCVCFGLEKRTAANIASRPTSSARCFAARRCTKIPTSSVHLYTPPVYESALGERWETCQPEFACPCPPRQAKPLSVLIQPNLVESRMKFPRMTIPEQEHFPRRIQRYLIFSIYLYPAASPRLVPASSKLPARARLKRSSPRTSWCPTPHSFLYNPVASN